MSRSHSGFVKELEDAHSRLAAAQDTQEFRELDPLMQREIQACLYDASNCLYAASNAFKRHSVQRYLAAVEEKTSL